MATQSGITVESLGAPWDIVDTISRPVPGKKQALVKSIVVGLNPVETWQQQYGLLVNEWPAVLGSDFTAVVIELGEGCTRLEKGDYVFGCSLIGQNKYTPFQDTFLVDEDLVFKKGDDMSFETASATAVGLLTASLGVLCGTSLSLPPPGTVSPRRSEWLIVLGGSGTVGQFAVQLANLCGYDVLASCSSSKALVATSQGASATFDGRASVDEQLAEIQRLTGGNFARIFDATAFGYELSIKAMEAVSTNPVKYFSSVDDWSPFDTPSSIKEYRTELGHIGRYDEDLGAAVSSQIAEWIPVLEAQLAAGSISPVEYQLVKGTGWGAVINGIKEMEAGKAAKKLAVRIVEE